MSTEPATKVEPTPDAPPRAAQRLLHSWRGPRTPTLTHLPSFSTLDLQTRRSARSITDHGGGRTCPVASLLAAPPKRSQV